MEQTPNTFFSPVQASPFLTVTSKEERPKVQFVKKQDLKPSNGCCMTRRNIAIAMIVAGFATALIGALAMAGIAHPHSALSVLGPVFGQAGSIGALGAGGAVFGLGMLYLALICRANKGPRSQYVFNQPLVPQQHVVNIPLSPPSDEKTQKGDGANEPKATTILGSSNLDTPEDLSDQ